MTERPVLKPERVFAAFEKHFPHLEVVGWWYRRTLANDYDFHDPGRMSVALDRKDRDVEGVAR